MKDHQDFRDIAVAASEALLTARGGSVDDPFAADVSFCLRADPDARQLMKLSRRRLIVAAVLGIIGIALGGGIACWGQAHRGDSRYNENETLLLAGLCSAGGFAVLIGHVLWVR